MLQSSSRLEMRQLGVQSRVLRCGGESMVSMGREQVYVSGDLFAIYNIPGFKPA
jgi:hypothetical protein